MHPANQRQAAQPGELIPFLRKIVSGPTWERYEREGAISIRLPVILCNFMPAFIPKGRIGRHFRAISRNGLILLMSSLETGSFESVPAELRLITWHQRIFKESAPEPYGVLMILRPLVAVRPSLESRQYCSMLLGTSAEADAELVLDLGGNKFLSILRCEPASQRGLAAAM